ncbi:MAG: hypothetical protein M1823_004003 [Watsoniomyces obsoletus]|nr:MAG: hypothetical protein M1823_004003 [Watsoniomyces obsoletus]
MLSTTVFTFASLAVATMASPTLVARTTKNEEDQTQKCGNNAKFQCCNSFQKSTLNLIPINLGINCVDVDVLSVIPVTDQCSQTVACCQSGSQTGLINVGNVCPVIIG